MFSGVSGIGGGIGFGGLPQSSSASTTTLAQSGGAWIVEAGDLDMAEAAQISGVLSPGDG